MYEGSYLSSVYIGLTKKGDTNYTKWNNAAPLTYWTGWKPGEPAWPTINHCAVLLWVFA